MNSSVSYPSDWDLVPIKELGGITSGGTPSRSVPAYWNGTIPWVAPNELTGMGDKYLNCTKERITSNGLAASAAKLLPVGSILVTSRATIGSVAIAGVPVSTNQGFKNIVPSTRNDSVFYYYCLQTLISEMYRRAIGSTFLEISKTEFERILAPRPHKLEQTAIARILDTVDETIRQTAAVIEKLKKIKAGLLHDLLTRGIDENGLLRDPVRHPEQFKESPLGKVPKEWDVLTLGNAAVRIQDGTHFSPKSKSGPFMYLTSRNIRFGTIDLKDVGRISSRDHAFIYARCPVQYGDVLLTKDGANTGNAALNYLPFQFSLLSSVAFIRCDDKTLHAPYLLQFLLAPVTQRRLKDQMSGNAIPRITVSKIESFEIPVPLLNEQMGIAGILATHDGRINAEVATLRKLTMMKQGLMQDLLQGRVRVPVDIAAAQEQEPVAAAKGKKETNIYFKRSVLAAEIVSQMHKSPTFGHVKFMKTLYLVEQLAHVALKGHYHRAAAGPLDNQMIRSVDNQMKKQKWFRAVPRDTAGGKPGGYTYEAMEKAGGHREWFEKYWEGARAKIQAVIDLLQRLDTQQCEIIATLYSAWADRLSAGQTVTDDAIITEVLTNWHESKQAIKHDRWAKALVWMREKALVPIMGGGE